jgi:hypothetical protein
MARERYYLRILPIPLSWTQILNAPLWSMTMRPIEAPSDLPSFDLTEDNSLRVAIRYIRELSPVVGAQQSFRGESGVASWLAFLRTTPMYCTDGSLLTVLLASRQGLAAREWQLWSSAGYADGSAHSLAEFYNPRLGRWQAVDGQTATLFFDQQGPMGVTDILQRFAAGEADAIIYERVSLHAATMPSLDPGFLLSINWSTPVASLVAPSWMSSRPALVPVIGMAVITGSSRHDMRIYWTKLAAVVFVFALGYLAVAAVRRPHGHT